MARSRVGRLSRVAFCASLAALGLWGPAPAEAPPAAGAAGVASSDTPLVTAVVPFSGTIDRALRTSALNRANDAVRDGARRLVFHITSNGGFVDDGMELTRDLERLAREDGVRTVAFVDAKAYSAATMAALACQEIVMTPEAEIGDCAPIMVGPQGLETLGETEREKQESPLRKRMESMAERNGYPAALAKAMVTRRLAVVEMVNRESGEKRYIEEQDVFSLGAEWEKTKVVVGPDELLTLSSREAEAYGFARRVIAGFDELYDVYATDGAIVEYPVTWNEKAVLLLNHMVLKALLVLVGLLGLYVEMTTPGFGVPGTIGLVSFGILFAASFLAGRPDWLPPLLFAAGGVMLAVELFVTPGFGVLGGVGLLTILGSVVLALSGFRGLPQREFEWQQLYVALGMTAGILVAFALAAWGLAQVMPRVPVLNRLVLGPSVVSDGSSRAAGARQERYVAVGEVGRTDTRLRPTGKARFGERLADVVTEGDYVDAGRSVRVVEVRGNRIVVEAAEGAEEA